MSLKYLTEKSAYYITVWVTMGKFVVKTVRIVS